MRRLGPEDWTMKINSEGNYDGEMWKQAEEISRIWTVCERKGESCEPATGEKHGDHTSLEEGEAKCGWTKRIFLYRISYSLVPYTLHVQSKLQVQKMTFLPLDCTCAFRLSSFQNSSTLLFSCFLNRQQLYVQNIFFLDMGRNH